RQPLDRPPETRRIFCEDKQHDQRTCRNGRGGAAGPFDRLEGERIRERDIAAEHEHIRREEDEHGDGVEQTLDNERGKCARDTYLLVPREEVWANDLASPRRQQTRRRKTNGRCTKDIG